MSKEKGSSPLLTTLVDSIRDRRTVHVTVDGVPCEAYVTYVQTCGKGTGGKKGLGVEEFTFKVKSEPPTHVSIDHKEPLIEPFRGVEG